MRDLDVRKALHSSLLSLHAEELTKTRFIDELDLCGEVRVDVAVVNGSLSGFELKSARDTLRRLPKQIELYSSMLDYSTLVVAENHLQSAVSMIPDWWGVVVAHDGPLVSLTEARGAEFNPTIDPALLVRLLWRDELLTELAQLGLDKGVKSKPRRALWERLSSEVPLETIREIVRRCLKARSGWRVDSVQSSNGAM